MQDRCKSKSLWRLSASFFHEGKTMLMTYKIVEHISDLSPHCPPPLIFARMHTKSTSSERHSQNFRTVQGLPSRIPRLKGTHLIHLSRIYMILSRIPARRNIWLGKNPKCPLTGTVEAANYTHMMQYRRNPRYAKSRSWNKFRSKRPRPRGNNRIPQTTISFEEFRRRKECHKCSAPNWTSQQMEGDISSNRSDEGLFGVLYGSEIEPADAEYDAYLTQREDDEAHCTGFTEAVELADPAIYATHIASAMSPPPTLYSDFRPCGAGQ